MSRQGVFYNRLWPCTPCTPWNGCHGANDSRQLALSLCWRCLRAGAASVLALSLCPIHLHQDTSHPEVQVTGVCFGLTLDDHVLAGPSSCLSAAVWSVRGMHVRAICPSSPEGRGKAAGRPSAVCVLTWSRPRHELDSSLSECVAVTGRNTA